MNQIEVMFVFLSILPIIVLLYGVKSWRKPVQWGKNMRGGYHSRRADKTPEHWMFAQMEYARLNIKTGAIWSVIGIVQLVLWKMKLLSAPIGVGAGLVECVVYYIAARWLMEQKLSKRFDESDALLGR